MPERCPLTSCHCHKITTMPSRKKAKGKARRAAKEAKAVEEKKEDEDELLEAQMQ